MLRFFRITYTHPVSNLAGGATKVPPPADLEAMRRLSEFLGSADASFHLVGSAGESVPLPAEALQVLRTTAASMRVGQAVTVAAFNVILTTQEAANYLGISRPTLVKLLDQGEIAYNVPGAGHHRRVRLDRVLDYQQRKAAGRRSALDGLTEQAATAGLYDGVPDYEPALRAARKHHGSRDEA